MYPEKLDTLNLDTLNLVWFFIYIHTLCMWKAKALQQDCLDAQASLSLKLLLAGVIRTKICTGPYNIYR